MQSEHIIRGYKALAAYLRIGIESARKLMNQPDFVTITLSPHVRIIPVSALEEWLQKQTNHSNCVR